MKDIQVELAPDLDEKARIEITQSFKDKWTAFLIDLERCSDNPLKLEYIRSKMKETKKKIIELNSKRIASDEISSMEMDLMIKGMIENSVKVPRVKIETFKFFNWKSKKVRGVVRDELKPGGCAHQYGMKVQKELIVWLLLYTKLKECKAEIINTLTIYQPKELPATPVTETPVAKEDLHYTLDCQSIFKDLDARRIFEYLQSNLVREKTQLADYTFILRRMQKDGYILEGIKEKTFKEFLSHHFQIHFNSKLKPMGYSTTDWKEKIYANAITSIKTN